MPLPTSESSLMAGEGNSASSQSDTAEIAEFLTGFQQKGQDMTKQDI